MNLLTFGLLCEYRGVKGLPKCADHFVKSPPNFLMKSLGSFKWGEAVGEGVTMAINSIVVVVDSVGNAVVTVVTVAEVARVAVTTAAPVGGEASDAVLAMDGA